MNENTTIGGTGYITLAHLNSESTIGDMVKCDLEDFGYLSRFKWCLDGNGYAHGTVNGELKKMHQIIMGKPLDHINRNKLDNRKCNLRKCTKKQNMANSKLSKRNNSGYRGVILLANGKWNSYIRKDGKRKHIGNYEIKEDAAKAYDEISREIFGEFAYQNFPTTR